MGETLRKVKLYVQVNGGGYLQLRMEVHRKRRMVSGFPGRTVHMI